MWADDEETAARLAVAFREYPRESMERAWRLLVGLFGFGFIFGLLVGAVSAFAWVGRT